MLTIDIDLCRATKSDSNRSLISSADLANELEKNVLMYDRYPYYVIFHSKAWVSIANNRLAQDVISAIHPTVPTMYLTILVKISQIFAFY